MKSIHSSWGPLLLQLCLAAMPATVIATDVKGSSPPDLTDVLKTMPISPEASKINGLRFSALRETGTSYGAQAGLARRTHENIKRLQSREAELDATFNFQSLMLEGNVVPPVLTEVSDFYDQSNGEMLRVIGKVFRIDQQARFSYTAPNWRTYLLIGYDFDSNAVAAVTPQTSDERQVWEAAVRLGFEKGREQADGILKDNFARLQRDYVGMVRYHQMLDAGMVTAPFVASNSTAVTRAEDGAMHVGEVFLRITAAPDFVAETHKWKGGEGGSANTLLKNGVAPSLPSKVLPKPKK